MIPMSRCQVEGDTVRAEISFVPHPGDATELRCEVVSEAMTAPISRTIR